MPIPYMDILLDVENLYTMDEILGYLKQKNEFWTMNRFRDRYIDNFDTDIVVDFPAHDQFMGYLLVPVKEGFLYLPYDEDTTGSDSFVLEDAKLVDVTFLANQICEYKTYYGNLIKTLTDARTILETEKLPMKKAGNYVAFVEDDENRDVNVNKKLREITEESYASGFLVTIISTTYANGRYAITYQLKPDPSFHSPM